MKLLLVSLVSLSLLAVCGQAHASLGGDSSSIDADQIALGGQQRTSVTKPKYTIEEIATHAGVVREYLSTNGKVFAIAWTGQSHPDLSLLMGKSFKGYSRASSSQPRMKGHRHSKVTTSSNVYVERSGHMRKVAGRAVDPSLVPQGVSTNEIR